jgi:hypothetical protein
VDELDISALYFSVSEAERIESTLVETVVPGALHDVAELDDCGGISAEIVNYNQRER